MNPAKHARILLIFGASFWFFFSLAWMNGTLSAFQDLDPRWFFLFFSPSFLLMRCAMDSLSLKQISLSMMAGLMVFSAASSVDVFSHVRGLHASYSCSRNSPDSCLKAANYYRYEALVGGHSDIVHFESMYKIYTQKLTHEAQSPPYFSKTSYQNERPLSQKDLGQLYATCLFGSREEMKNKMNQRDAYAWLAYSRFGTPRDIFGGFKEGKRTVEACETLIDVGILDHQEVGCTGLKQLCNYSGHCLVRRKQCKVVLSSPF